MKNRTRPIRTAGSPSLADIARVAEVSLPTASLAMSNHPRVSERTKLRVMDAAAKAGYVPNHLARKMVRARLNRRSETFDRIAFIAFDHTKPAAIEPPAVSILCGIEQEVASYDATVTFLRLATDSAADKIGRLLKTGGLDGCLIINYVNDETLRLLRAPNMPCVVVGWHACKQPVHQVEVNYRAAGRMAAEHLAQAGHRRVGFISGSMRHWYQPEILKGFRTAARELGLDDDAALYPPPGDVVDPLHAGLERVLAVQPAPTAIFVQESGYGPIVLSLLQRRGHRVPDDISVVGCEVDGGYCALTELTRIELPFAEVGRAATTLLHELVSKGDRPARQVLIAPRLVGGTTCRNLNQQ